MHESRQCYVRKSHVRPARSRYWEEKKFAEVDFQPMRFKYNVSVDIRVAGCVLRVVFVLETGNRTGHRWQSRVQATKYKVYTTAFLLNSFVLFGLMSNFFFLQKRPT